MSLGRRLYCSAMLAPGVAESAMVGGCGRVDWSEGGGCEGAKGRRARNSRRRRAVVGFAGVNEKWPVGCAVASTPATLNFWC